MPPQRGGPGNPGSWDKKKRKMSLSSLQASIEMSRVDNSLADKATENVLLFTAVLPDKLIEVISILPTEFPKLAAHLSFKMYPNG